MRSSSEISEVSEWRERFGGAALVTGACSGIGKAFAKALAARGMDLVLVSRERERLEVYAHELEAQFRIRAVAMMVDLSRPDAAQTIRARAEAAGLSVGLLINNAGYALYGPFAGQDPVEQAGMVDVNCRAPLSLARTFAPDMIARRRGGIVFVASTAAYQPTPHMAVYAATKVFDLFLAEALWAELGRHGVDVLALSPGHARTEFQARSGDPVRNPPGGIALPEEIVATALSALGRKPTAIHGLRNIALAIFVRILPRTTVLRLALRHFEQLDAEFSPGKEVARVRPRLPASTDGRFARGVARMLAAFLAVSFIDLVVCSLLTHKLRFWFPAWLDAHWDTDPNTWVTYSQSYASGIVFIPLLAFEVVREFVPRVAIKMRTAFFAGTLGLLAFLGWWKGGLMLRYHKQEEAIAWIALTAVTWSLLRIGEELPALMANVKPRQLAAGLARGVSIFFLVMAVVDPLLCVGVQHLPWSKGLIVEVSFFVPAGIILWALASRLKSRGRRARAAGERAQPIAGKIISYVHGTSPASPPASSAAPVANDAFANQVAD
ncbi:MAG TPA: SDR family oxidoreductase [Tepidisphaeraceae bacterium]|nr:SDR family oxidoreductase [Tepidisphaeraceae bacterium]